MFKNSISLFCFLLLFSSCIERQSEVKGLISGSISQEQKDSILDKCNFYYENPILIEDSEYVLLPVATKKGSDIRKSKLDYKYREQYNTWNIVFFNRVTKEMRLLTEDKIRIAQIDTKGKYSELNYSENHLPGKILYYIQDIDLNNDGKLNSLDPDFLFVSNVDGTGLKKISPNDESAVYYVVVPNTTQILLKTKRDINQDSIFNEMDESIWYQTELVEDEWQIQEIIDSTNRKSIENLYFNQWIKSEK